MLTRNLFIINILTYVPAIVLVLNISTYSQDLNMLENDYFKLLNNYQSYVDMLDSATHRYNVQIRNIENEKSKDNRDENTIAGLMAAAVVTSDSLDIIRESIDSTKSIINERKEVLNRIYSQKIDSLKDLEADENFTGNRSELNIEILSLIEKRLLVRPQITTLSYNPKELVKLTSTALNDTSDQKLLEDYIRSALTEVNTQLDQISNMTNRIDEVLSLQEKVQDFIEESGMQTNISRFSSQSQYAKGSDMNNYNPGEDIGNNMDFAKDAVNIIPQARTFSILFDQLNINENLSQQNPAQWNQYLDGTSGFISLKDYLEILREIKVRLIDYKSILENKLSR